MVAVMDDCDQCEEINIEGDCVWGVFATPYLIHINETFNCAVKLNTVMKLVNKRLGIKGIESLNYGIGISYGRALMIKAGYYGSGLNEIVYMGDVVNRASKLCSKSDAQFDQAITCSDSFYSNLNEENKNLLHNPNLFFGDYYQGNVINTAYNEWIDQYG